MRNNRNNMVVRFNKTLILYYAVLLLIPCNGLAQSAPDLKFQAKKKFIDKVEVSGGPCLYIPNDHGWAEFVFKGSDGRTIYKANSEIGYQMGLSIVHSINSRFEIQGKFSFSKTRYSENREYLDFNDNVTARSKTDQKNNYLVLSLVPTYFLFKNKLHVFSGFSYAFLSHSMAYDTDFSAGQSIVQPSINTIDGFRKQVVNALMGIGYCHPISRRIEGTFRIQGEYGLSYTSSQNKQSMTIHNISLSLGIRYSR